ncbi:type 1 glutamine amidotransferase [Geomonas nitrogeniifigens]|uniref:Type 1 glutamine amidotransferase n=1 Tax=Geomonas diazotrophica TaxID=2843197 RepID=A0ABX8JG07_9BACT|nr:type 1 glutamine amidotransferase [Geomonas nitrogeniifigens]QWV96076.1 type 1 glutamine amidotransferase [Geomonas nitrogeniifigens]QXE85144.1 type 1 glutamine amidotransferase [Geomonas nitrogeniifigens]
MFLIVQNDPHCPAGGLVGILDESGHPYRCLAAYAAEPFPDPATLAGIVVLGGEMGVHDTVEHPHLARVLEFIEAAIKAGTPLLGICLGGQLLSHATGGVVSSPSCHGEMGICRVELNGEGSADPLFAGVPTPFVTFQLHGDSFTVPPGGTLLASSGACPAQAFRLPGSVYGVQFHPEVDRAIVDGWDGLFTPRADYLSGFIAAETEFNAASRAILANFISLAAAARLP